MINRLFIPGKKTDIKAICKNGFNSFILPVENLSIGFDSYFSLEEINTLSSEHDIYLMINKFFHHDEIDNVIELLSNIKNIKGMFIEDLGLLMNVKNQNLILYQNHLNMNAEAISAYYDMGITSAVLSNELTIDEIRTIRKNTQSKLYYFMVSKNIIMYTRRNLLTNYYKYFDIKDISLSKSVTESVSRHNLVVKELDYGTAILNDKIFSGNNMLDDLKENIDYLIYNFTDMDEDTKSTILENIDSKDLNEKIDADDYFLHNEIFYKVKDVA